jgi:hypothetical protein
MLVIEYDHKQLVYHTQWQDLKAKYQIIRNQGELYVA